MQKDLSDKSNIKPDNEKAYVEIINSKSIEEFKQKLRNFHCTRCPLSNDIVQFPTTSRGNPNSNIMIVGEAPGHNEMVKGIPFVGKAGQVMDLLLSSISISSELDVYITNICRCRPRDNRAPHTSEAQTCITYLKKEIELIKPKYILTMGATSAKYLLSNNLTGKSMGEIVGQYYYSQEYPDSKFLVLYHPAALIYNKKLKIPMIEHLNQFRDLIFKDNT